MLFWDLKWKRMIKICIINIIYIIIYIISYV